MADRIAYMNHDIEDAIRAGILQKEELPKDVLEVLGDTKTKRITCLVGAVVEHGSETIGMAPEIQAMHDKLHASCLNGYTIIPSPSRRKTRQSCCWKRCIPTLFPTLP